MSKYKTIMTIEEFGKTLNIYTGIKNEFKGSQYLRISPSSSSFINYSSSLEDREFGIDLVLHFQSPNSKESSNDQVMRLISRIESLIFDNSLMTLSDNTIAYNCRIESTEINTESEGEYIVNMDFKCIHSNRVWIKYKIYCRWICIYIKIIIICSTIMFPNFLRFKRIKTKSFRY